MITISAFAWVPPFARGQVRDLRVRWALEEAGLTYRTRLLEKGDQDTDEYRGLQPFGQVPVFEEDGFVLFETGAIIHHVGHRSKALLPLDPRSRARALQWMFSALNSVEPFLMQVVLVDIVYAGEEWAKLRRPSTVAIAQRRLAALSAVLGNKPFLEDEEFTAGDLLMSSVLNILSHTDIVTSDPRLAAYVDRCHARPAYQRALASHLADFRADP